MLVGNSSNETPDSTKNDTEMDWRIYNVQSLGYEERARRRELRDQAERISANRVYGTTWRCKYMGMFPAACRIGDIVVVLSGGPSAYLLRQRRIGYAFLGECYVHGIMNGEAMGDGKGLEKFVLE